MAAVDESSAKKRKLEDVSDAQADVKMEDGAADASPQSLTESERSNDRNKAAEDPAMDKHSVQYDKTAGNPLKSTAASQKTAVRRLLDPFTREQLLEILVNAATRSDALYAELKVMAGADVAHRKVFVRGLAWETKTEHLKEAFAAFGDVQEGAVIYDKNTGKSRGYGFITFVEMEAAQRAVEQQTVTIDGRRTSCNLAAVREHTEDHQHHSQHTQTLPSPRRQPQQPERSTSVPRQAPSHTVYMALPATRMYPAMSVPMPTQGVPPPPSIQQQQRQQSQQQPQASPQQRSSRHNDEAADRKLFVRGLSWDTSDDTLRREFQTFGELEEAMIARDRKTNRSKGYAFVTYKHKAGADRALKTPQKFIDGRTTCCNLACQGHNKPHTEQRSSSSAILAPVPPSYTMPMAPVGMYAAVPYQGVAMPQQPIAYGQYPAMPPSPYTQPPQPAYATVPPYFQGRAQVQPQLPQLHLQQPPPPRR